MQIVVNHLTRMSPGRICVAGIDVSSRQHVRPVVSEGLATYLLQRNGGPFDMGNIVDLGFTIPQPRIPKVEDHSFYEENAKIVRQAMADGFWCLLKRISRGDLVEIFGDELVSTVNGRAYLPVNTGKASLGCLVPMDKPRLFIDRREKLRISIVTKIGGNVVNLALSCTDIRFYMNDHVGIDENVVFSINERLKKENVVLGVGVGYPLAASDYYPEAHWLQVNAVHITGGALWQLD